jgi:SAM-dependent methyltransferase
VHVQAFDFVAAHVGRLAPASVLEIGSLDINGSVRTILDGEDVAYHGLDVVAGPGVDEVGDAASWEAERTYEMVVSTEVLEHAPRWDRIVETAWRAVAPGGRLLLSCATDPRPPHSAVDGLDVRDGEHYRNVAPGDIVALAEAWRNDRLVVEAHLGRGDLYVRVDKSLDA